MHKSAYSVIAFLCIILLHSGPAPAEKLAYVRWVDDGDTIVLADGRHIRYIGINAPEIGHADTGPDPLGREAKNFNRQMVLRKQIRLEFDNEKMDHYGRKLAYLFSPEGIFINREMLFHGYAHYLYRYPNIRYHEILLAAQRAAMKAEKGIWRDWHETERRYIGNKNSKRFHLESCPLGRKIRPGNRIYFTKRWDAFWQGYSPGKNCLPKGFLP